MKLRIFQSDKGDCLLLEAASGETMLCDGGMAASMRAHVRDELGKLRVAGKALDLVYVSHIDQDHISGVLQLLEDEVEWRVFDHHQATGNPIKKPRVPRPPVIKGILHNAFRDQITANNKPIASLLAARAIESLLNDMAPTLFATAIPELSHAADEMQAIAASIPEALKVSKLSAPDALDIPINKPPGVNGPARLLFAGQPGDRFKLGSLDFTLVGPTEKELRNLRDGWNNWLRDNRGTVKSIRAEIKRRVEDFSTGESLTPPFDLRDWNGIPDFEGVTAPNIASLMYLVEEGGKRLLLTGDGQQQFILDGLKRIGALQNGAIHLDVLKVQHHGSEHNMDVAFARAVSADHYVFCGNGENTNPEVEVIDFVYHSRLGSQGVRARSPLAQNRPFHFWFSTNAKALPANTKQRTYFESLEKHVNGLAAKSNGLLNLHFNTGASITLQI